MKPKILLTDEEVHFENVIEELENIANVVLSESNDEHTLISHVGDTNIIVVSCFTKITSKLILNGKKLKAVIKYGVGVDNIDIATCTNQRIMVVNCPDYAAETISEHAFSLMICLAKKIVDIDRIMRRNGWIWPKPEYMGVDLFNKSLGIIGLGNIGRAMAKRAEGFGMKKLVYDPYVNEEIVRQLGAEQVPLDKLLRESDFVSIHCILTPETKGLIGEKELKIMKNTAYLINVSRGEIIDENALIKALENGWIAGSGIDVFKEEPLSANHPFIKMKNVVLTPHLAWYTREASDRLEKEAFDRILEILHNKKPKNVKNPEVFANSVGDMEKLQNK